MMRFLHIAAALAFVLLRPVSSFAFELRVGDGTNDLAVSSGESLDSESLLVAQSLVFDGTSAKDLWLLARNGISFDGASAGDLRLIARSAVVAGSARQNLLAYAAGLQLATNSVVEGQAALLGDVVVCEGRVDGDAWILARSATVGGRWGGSLRVQAEEIRLVPGTAIAGDLVYAAPKPPFVDPSVSIGGTLRRSNLDAETGEAWSLAALADRALALGYAFLAALLVGIPFVGLFPHVAGGAVRSLRVRPWRVFAAGLLVVFGSPFLFAFCIVTVVGIPLAIVVAALFALLLAASPAVVALWIAHSFMGSPAPRSFGRVLSSLSAGLAAICVVAAIPGVASFVALPVFVLGGGALAVSLFGPSRFAVVVPPPPPFKNNEPPPPNNT